MTGPRLVRSSSVLGALRFALLVALFRATDTMIPAQDHAVRHGTVPPNPLSFISTSILTAHHKTP